MTDSDLKRYNRIFTDELGRAPNGWPLYKWVRTRDLFYLIQDGVDVITPAGLYTRTNDYRKVTWEQRLGAQWPWIIATWQDPGTPSMWYARYRRNIPYPPQGMYFPLVGSQIPCEPSMEITHEAVAKIKSQLSQSFDETLAGLIDEADRQDAAQIAQSDDHIDSDWPAFNCEVTIPGYTPKKEIICPES